MVSRREFLKLTGATVAGFALSSQFGFMRVLAETARDGLSDPALQPKFVNPVPDALSSGFIYTTLKVGITGARATIDNQGLAYIDTIKKQTRLPVAAGFGISSPDQVKQLEGIADIVVIGSHVINLFDQHGLTKVIEFLDQCKEN